VTWSDRLPNFTHQIRHGSDYPNVGMNYKPNAKEEIKKNTERPSAVVISSCGNAKSASLDCCVFGLRLPEQRDVRVGVIPKAQELLVGAAGLGVIPETGIRSSKLKMGQSAK